MDSLENKRVRHICFTYNGIEQDEECSIYLEKFRLWEQIDFAVYQLEQGSHTRRLHLQGYLHFRQPVVWRTIQNKFESWDMRGAHFEKCHGTTAHNYKYCTKVEGRIDGPWEFGNVDEITQGHRSDLSEVAQKIINKISMRQIAEEHSSSFIRYHKGFEKLHDVLHNSTPRQDLSWKDLDLRWFYGPSGSGKTTFAYQEYEDERFYVKTPTNKWWDNYDGEKHVIIDDYRVNRDFVHDDFLRLGQPFRCQQEKKGSSVEIVATNVIVTSNYAPWEQPLWPFMECDISQGPVKEFSPIVRRWNFYRFFITGREDSFKVKQIEKKLQTNVIDLTDF